jgi:hypothetical protein
MQIAKDQHGAEARGLEWREWWRFEVGAEDFDLACAAIERAGSNTAKYVEKIGIAIDCNHTEPEVGRGEGVAPTTTGQVERRACPSARGQS